MIRIWHLWRIVHVNKYRIHFNDNFCLIVHYQYSPLLPCPNVIGIVLLEALPYEVCRYEDISWQWNSGFEDKIRTTTCFCNLFRDRKLSIVQKCYQRQLPFREWEVFWVVFWNVKRHAYPISQYTTFCIQICYEP